MGTSVSPCLAAKLLAELPVGAFFPLCFGAVVYPMAGAYTHSSFSST
jgi:hypothetical protein